MTVREEVLSVLRNSGESMDSLQIFNKCQVAERKEVSTELKELCELGILKRDSKKRYSFDVLQAEEKASGTTEVVKAVCDGPKHMVVQTTAPVSMPQPLSKALSELELALKPPANDSEFSPEIKMAALDQLAKLLHPSIAEVLMEVKEDIERISKVG